jgi:glycosyltransferase involved in cell wall biosynthesis
MASTASSPASTDGVTFVVPVRNGARWLACVLDAILAQDPGGDFEVLAIDDGSTDGSAEILDRYIAGGRVRLVQSECRGAAAAINLGLSLARCPLIAQVDQDVVVGPDWLTLLRDALKDESVGAAQGYYVTDRESPLLVRVMGLDLEQRYAGIEGTGTNHVCTGNTLYRALALARVGGFDETLGYGYDNDVSYRLGDAGFSLVLCREARSRHYWREGLWSYLRQQYGFGYGRLDLVARHRRRLTCDAVSPGAMMLHPLILLVAAGAFLIGVSAGGGVRSLLAPLLLVGVLVVERSVAGIRAFRRFRDPAAFAFPLVHLLRDAAWVAAVVVWTARRLMRRRGRPDDSMRPRSTRRPTEAA